jgi:AcrR family transcriptional regulator
MAEIQRGRILAAMAEEAAARGTAAVTVAHVVARAGVSRRTFYELFADRDACLSAAFEDALARLERQVRAADDQRAGWAERIRSGLIAVLSFLDADRPVARLLLMGQPGPIDEARERRQRVLAQVTAFVDSGRERSRAGPRLPPLTAEGVVGGALSILQTRVIERPDEPLLDLAGSLMATIVHPFLGAAAARRELARPRPPAIAPAELGVAGPLGDLRIRLTYRTVRVLMVIAELSAQGLSSSNRAVGAAADIHDQGQISKLLTRLHRLGLIENGPAGLARGAPNAWVLTDKGREIERAVGGRS